MAKQQSRANRWASATSDVQETAGALRAALESLREIQQEFEEWRDNLPENLQGNSAISEKLDEVCDNLDIEGMVQYIDEIEELAGEAEGADLPLGFGRD